MDERIMPAVITDNKTGDKYELDFSRDSIRFAENRGFELENVAKFPVTGVADLFFYAFRMHHRNVSRDKTDKLMERWGGIPEGLALARACGFDRICWYQQHTPQFVNIPD